MQVHIHLLSILRDLAPAGAKQGKATIDLPEQARVVDLVSHLGIGDRLGIPEGRTIVEVGWQILVNGQFEADPGRVLAEGDQVSIFPPMAGG